MIFQTLILLLLLLSVTPLCQEISRQIGDYFFTGALKDGNFKDGTYDIFNISCQYNDFFIFPDSLLAARINAPIVFYKFDDVPQTIEIPNYQPFFSCFENGGCSFTCPNESPGKCIEDSNGPSSFCYGYYLASTAKYTAYSLRYVDALTVTNYKSSFSAGKPQSSNIFDKSEYTSVHYPIFGNDNAVLNGFPTTVNNNDNATYYYYLPGLNRLIGKKKLIELKTQSPKVSFGNQLAFDCKTQIPQVQLDTSPLNVEEWPSAPFNWIAVTGSSKNVYTAEQFATTKLKYFTANGFKSALIDTSDIVWDPCHQDHFTLKVQFGSDGTMNFQIGIDPNWNYDTVCIVLEEVGSRECSLAQFDLSSKTFQPTDRWTGLISDNIIDTYNIILTRSSAGNNLLPPDSIITLNLDFSEQGMKPEVVISADKEIMVCEIRFGRNCSFTTGILPQTYDLKDCLPLNPMSFYSCGVSFGIIQNPDFMVYDQNVSVSNNGDTEKSATIPTLKAIDDSGNNQSQNTGAMSLGDYFTDFSLAANLYRAILILAASLAVLFVLILSRFILKQRSKRKSRYKLQPQILPSWRKI